MFLRKFFDPVATGGGGTEPEAQATQGAPSIAAIMATQGRKVDGDDSTGLSPNVNKEVKEEPTTATEVTPAATATETPKAESENPESQTQPVAEATPPAETPIAQAEVKPEPTLQEVLRSQQPDNVLKELGFDDEKVKFIQSMKEIDPKMVAFLQKWENKEDLTGYLKELVTDYNKMPAEEVMRHQLQLDYPKASESQLNSLYKSKVINAYSLDPDRFSEEEQAEGRLLMEAEADRNREKLIERQQNFLLPKPPEAKAPEVDLQAQKAQQEFEVYKSAIDNSPVFKNVAASKQVSIGEGEEKFNYPVDPETIKGLMFDNSKWAETQFDIVRNPDGSVNKLTPKVEDQILTVAFAQNPKKFISELSKHFKALGGKAAIEPIDNARPPDGSTPVKSEVPITNAAAAAAKHGRLVPGGY